MIIHVKLYNSVQHIKVLFILTVEKFFAKVQIIIQKFYESFIENVICI